MVGVVGGPCASNTFSLFSPRRSIGRANSAGRRLIARRLLYVVRDVLYYSTATEQQTALPLRLPIDQKQYASKPCYLCLRSGCEIDKPTQHLRLISLSAIGICTVPNACRHSPPQLQAPSTTPAVDVESRSAACTGTDQSNQQDRLLHRSAQFEL